MCVPLGSTLFCSPRPPTVRRRPRSRWRPPPCPWPPRPHHQHRDGLRGRVPHTVPISGGYALPTPSCAWTWRAPSCRAGGGARRHREVAGTWSRRWPPSLQLRPGEEVRVAPGRSSPWAPSSVTATRPCHAAAPRGGSTTRPDAEGDHRPGSQHQEDQVHRKHSGSGAPSRPHVHLPADVEQQAGAGGARLPHRPLQMLLGRLLLRWSHPPYFFSGPPQAVI